MQDISFRATAFPHGRRPPTFGHYPRPIQSWRGEPLAPKDEGQAATQFHNRLAQGTGPYNPRRAILGPVNKPTADDEEIDRYNSQHIRALSVAAVVTLKSGEEEDDNDKVDQILRDLQGAGSIDLA